MVERTHLLEPFPSAGGRAVCKDPGWEQTQLPPAVERCPRRCSFTGRREISTCWIHSSAEVEFPSPSRQAASSRHFLRGLLCCSQLQDVLCFPFPCFSALYFSFDFRFPPLSIFQLFPQIIRGHGTSSPREPSWRYERL